MEKEEFTTEFDYLDYWAELSDSEIEEIITDDTIVILNEISDLLGGPPRKDINRTSFVEIVRKLREVKRIGSRILGHAIIEASDLKDKGEYEKACEIYENFISRCPSKFYRKIAQAQLDDIKDG